MKVVIYSGPGCPYCEMVKNFLKEHQGSFEEINLAEKPEAREDLIRKTGRLAVPVTVIDEQKVIVGFD